MSLPAIGSSINYATPTTIIGTQEWMTINLDTQYYNNGDPIPYISNPEEWATTTQGAWCWYGNDSSNNLFGKLYNYYAVIDPRGIAPSGFRVPTPTDIQTLITYVSLNEGGGKLKDTNTMYWNTSLVPGIPNFGATNEFGFSARGSGMRILNGGFQWKGYVNYSWVNADLIYSPFWGVGRETKKITLNLGYPDSKNYGFSVRCVKDIAPQTELNYFTKVLTYSTY